MSRTTTPPVDLATRSASRLPVAGIGVSAATGLAGLGALLAILSMTAGLGRAGWAVGLGCGALLTTFVARGLLRAGHDGLGPADLVTLCRALMGCGVAALTAESLLGHDVTPAILALAVPALALDAVDGPVARRTGTVTAFGGRLDGEVDAFLILVLSIAVAPGIGWWVLAAGLARYAFAVAGRMLPWLRGRLEFRYWRKVVTASVGIVLTVAVADVLPHGMTVFALVVALALLAESFGRDTWWLWRRRAPRDSARRRALRPSWALRVGVAAATVLAVVLVWLPLVVPTRPDRLTPDAFLRIPVEAVAVAALAVALSAISARSGSARSGGWARAATVVVGMLLAVLTVLKILDLAAFTVLDRPFNVVTDLGLLGSGVAFVGDSLGPWAARGSVVGAVVLVGVVAVCLPWAVGHLTTVAARHHRGAVRAVSALAAVWVLCAVSGLQVAPGQPVAAGDTAPYVLDKVHTTTAAHRELVELERTLAAVVVRDPASGELSVLKGKDVLVVFVESYGRTAIEGPESQSVRTLLDAGTARLRNHGYTATSAYLTSPTFGGSSWLAHATLQTGLQISDQGRYDRLLSSTRTTLTSVFSRAGWRTVALLPSTRGSWEEGRAFYHFDVVYGRSSLGYAGPKFGFSAMPDQYALAAFERLELASAHRPPVMAEIELTSSHGPWAPLPTTVERAALGDGSVFHGIRADAVTAAELWSDRDAVPGAYRTSIVYSLTSVLSFVEERAGDDLVVVLLGDHQPSTVVSGFGGNRDVPVTLIARDPKVVEQVEGWGWQDGLRPDEHAPVWPMSAFRDRFLAAYSSPSAHPRLRGPHEGG